jgi:transposase
MKRPSLQNELSLKEFEKVRHLLEGARKTTRPKIHDTYAVFCAVLFIVRDGVPWRSLPDCFPPWRSVHQHFLQWAPSGDSKTCLEEALEKLGLQDVSSVVRAQMNARRPSQM